MPTAIFRITRRPASAYTEFVTEFEGLINTLKEPTIEQFADELFMQDNKRKSLKNYMEDSRVFVEKNWSTLENRLSIIGGKRALKEINRWMKERYNKGCSPAQIIRNIFADEIDDEVKAAISQLCQ